jgi:DNA invertase Pin-like site-specific DNA recombinase
LDLARKRKVDVVLVWKFDRFARSTKQVITALEEFRELGIDFISYAENSARMIVKKIRLSIGVVSKCTTSS